MIEAQVAAATPLAWKVSRVWQIPAIEVQEVPCRPRGPGDENIKKNQKQFNSILLNVASKGPSGFLFLRHVFASRFQIALNTCEESHGVAIAHPSSEYQDTNVGMKGRQQISSYLMLVRCYFWIWGGMMPKVLNHSHGQEPCRFHQVPWR